MAGPLEGIRVIECGGYLSAPSACYMLGDLGAEIIKIEDRVKGDPARGVSTLYGKSMSLKGTKNILFETANRNKKSVTLDLKKEKGQAILHELIQNSDVFCTNYTAAAIAKNKLDYETLSLHNPKLVYGVASGYGLEGPESQKRAFDTVAQARSSIMYAVGDPDGPPQPVVGPVFDQMTGTLLAYGILAALIARDRQGIGQKVDVSLLGSGLHLLAYNVNTVLLGGRPMPRANRKDVRNVMANYFECADGKWLMFAEAQSDRFWPNFCNALEIKALEKDPRFENSKARAEHRVELTEIADTIFRQKNRDEWIRIFDAKGGGLAFSLINQPEDLKADPQVLANHYITKMDHPEAGEIDVIGCPVNFSKTPANVNSAAPHFGSSTEMVLIDVCNYSWEALEKLRDEAII